MDNLNASMVSRLRLPRPPIEAQNRIAEAIVSSSNIITKATNLANREIELLNEYHTRLIADVVTGKLDVREAAANLPDEAGDPGGSEGLMENGDGLQSDMDVIPKEADA